MITQSTCKINLGLHILFKREDNFHELETVMIEIPLSDEIELVENDSDVFICNDSTIDSKDNLCFKAVELLRKDFVIPPLKIRLQKNIPIGAGLGGGSANASKVLQMINQHFDLQISNVDLEKYAAQLGSDCAFFIKGKQQLCKGRGELLSSINIDLKGKFVVLINLGIAVSTAEAFSLIQPRKRLNPLKDLVLSPISTWKETVVNDFEESVFAIHPVLKMVKEDLYTAGAEYAAMSGSGSTVFGIFDSPVEIEKYKNAIVYHSFTL